MKFKSYIFNICLVIAFFSTCNNESFCQEPFNCFLDLKINEFKIGTDISQIIGNLEFSNCEPNCKLIFYNQDTTEKIEILFYPGRLKNVPSYFKVSKVLNTHDTTLNVLFQNNFITEYGIKLSESYDDIIKIFNNLDINIEKKEYKKSITYLGLDQADSCKFNTSFSDFCLYKSKYIFENNLLISFEMGFIYP